MRFPRGGTSDSAPLLVLGVPTHEPLALRDRVLVALPGEPPLAVVEQAHAIAVYGGDVRVLVHLLQVDAGDFDESVAREVPLVVEEPAVDRRDPEQASEDQLVDDEHLLGDPAHAEEAEHVRVLVDNHEGVVELVGEAAVRVVLPLEERRDEIAEGILWVDPVVRRQEAQIPRRKHNARVPERVLVRGVRARALNIEIRWQNPLLRTLLAWRSPPPVGPRHRNDRRLHIPGILPLGGEIGRRLHWRYLRSTQPDFSKMAGFCVP